jgi:hypothetical protein
MTTPDIDPTAARPARALREGRRLRLVPMDPTAGETARRRSEDPDAQQVVTDPTDPRNGAPLRDPA